MSYYDIIVEFTALEPHRQCSDLLHIVCEYYKENRLLLKVHYKHSDDNISFVSLLYRNSPGYYQGTFTHNDSGPAIINRNGEALWYWLGDRCVSFDHWCRCAEINDKKKAALKLKYSECNGTN